mmetsp:Transcript_27515/g.80312  ORF Transcript_27515/g.80312 Transcript_27515/m.80312 type:complete len:467 (+) Transcript_27515:1856-3256(+)
MLFHHLLVILRSHTHLALVGFNLGLERNSLFLVLLLESGNLSILGLEEGLQFTDPSFELQDFAFEPRVPDLLGVLHGHQLGIGGDPLPQGVGLTDFGCDAFLSLHQQVIGRVTTRLFCGHTGLLSCFEGILELRDLLFQIRVGRVQAARVRSQGSQLFFSLVHAAFHLRRFVHRIFRIVSSLIFPELVRLIGFGKGGHELDELFALLGEGLLHLRRLDLQPLILQATSVGLFHLLLVQAVDQLFKLHDPLLGPLSTSPLKLCFPVASLQLRLQALDFSSVVAVGRVKALEPVLLLLSDGGADVLGLLTGVVQELVHPFLSLDEFILGLGKSFGEHGPGPFSCLHGVAKSVPALLHLFEGFVSSFAVRHKSLDGLFEVVLGLLHGLDPSHKALVNGLGHQRVLPEVMALLLKVLLHGDARLLEVVSLEAHRRERRRKFLAHVSKVSIRESLHLRGVLRLEEDRFEHR